MSVTKGQRIRAQDVPGLAKANTFSNTNTFNSSFYVKSIEFKPDTSATNGGYLDFHFAGSTADYTSRIIESASGVLTISGSPVLGNTPATTDNSKKIATTAFVHAALIASGSVLPGIIMPFGGTSVPTGYLQCNGAAVSRTTYSALFSAIGTTWGAGDGSTTFNLPKIYQRELIEKKEPTDSDKTWYNLYSDGYCEQGGHANSTNTTYNFSKAYKDTDYNISFGTAPTASEQKEGQPRAITKYTTGFLYQSQNSVNTGADWCTKGYISATKGLTYKIIKY